MTTPVPGALADLGVCVVNYGSHALLERNVAPLAESVGTTVVVDNFSSIEERWAVEGLAAARSWTFVAHDRNIGFGAAMNVAADRAFAAGCRHVLLLNPDVVLEVAALERLLSRATSEPAALVTPHLVQNDGSTWFSGGRLDLVRGFTSTRARGDDRDSGGWLTGACLLVGRELWEELGGFNPRFFLYWEDVELSYRCVQHGGTLRVDDDVTAIHDVGGTQGIDGKSPIFCREMCKNRLRFAALHVSPQRRLRWVWHAPSYAMRLLSGRGRRDALRHPRRAAAALQGTITGVALVARSLITDRRSCELHRSNLTVGNDG